MQHTMMHRLRWFLAFALLLAFVVSSLMPAQAASEAALSSTDLPQPSGDVLLVVGGAIQRGNVNGEAQLDMEIIQGLPGHRVRTMTAVTDGVRQFDGFLMRDILDLVGAQGKSVEAQALNDYSVDIPVEDFYKYDVILATHMDGERLLASGKGPFWIIYPRDDWRHLQDIRYDYRWVWQLNRLTVR